MPIVVVWTLGCLIGAALLLLAGTVVPRARTAVRRGLARFWARGVARIASIEIQVEGEVPSERELWVSNHLSYLDPIVLLSVRRLVFLAKSEVRSWPGLGIGGHMAGTLFIDRVRLRDLLRVIPEMMAVLDRDESVLFFPEGTSTHGGVLLPFRSSLFEAAARSGTPVRCVSLHFETRPGDPPAWESVCWWGDMTFLDHAFRLLCVRGVRARIDIAPKPIQWSTDRKALSRAAETEVRQRFVSDPGAPTGPSIS
jgi:1-acyl-sn-glycerol-3-phosphate acyltransferase